MRYHRRCTSSASKLLQKPRRQAAQLLALELKLSAGIFDGSALENGHFQPRKVAAGASLSALTRAPPSVVTRKIQKGAQSITKLFLTRKFGSVLYSIVGYLLAIHLARRFCVSHTLCLCWGAVMPATDKDKAAKAARCGKCKTCLNPKSKRKCLDPKQPQEQQAAAAQFSSPVTRRQPDAGRGSRRVR